MEPAQITELDALEAALASDRFLLFKHSRVCPISSRAFAAYVRFARENPDVPTGWIDVVGQRPWSQKVAAVTGVTHQSPQAILIRGGKAAWHETHGSITADALADAVNG